MLERAEDVEAAVLLAMRPWYQRWLRHVRDESIFAPKERILQSLCIFNNFWAEYQLYFHRVSRKL
jgi:hypothetical protein